MYKKFCDKFAREFINRIAELEKSLIVTGSYVLVNFHNTDLGREVGDLDLVVPVGRFWRLHDLLKNMKFYGKSIKFESVVGEDYGNEFYVKGCIDFGGSAIKFDLMGLTALMSPPIEVENLNVMTRVDIWCSKLNQLKHTSNQVNRIKISDDIFYALKGG